MFCHNYRRNWGLFRAGAAFLLLVLSSCALPTYTGPQLDPGQFPREQIAYCSETELYLANMDGTGEEKLVTCPGDCVLPVWSPDATKIAYVVTSRGFSHLIRFRRPFSSEKSALMVYDFVTKRAERLCDITWCERQDPGVRLYWITGLFWLNDGRTLVVADKEGVHTVSLDGRLTHLSTQKNPRACTYFRTLSAILYVDKDGTHMVPDGSSGDGERFQSRAVSGFPDAVPYTGHAVSPDGRKVLYGKRRDLLVWSADTETSEKIYTAHQTVHGVQWFPDGERVLVLCGERDQRSGLRGTALPTGEFKGHFQLYVVNTLTGEERLIFAKLENDVLGVGFSRSPDGHHVALTDERGKLYVAALDGSGSAQIKLPRTCAGFAWRPEGR